MSLKPLLWRGLFVLLVVASMNICFAQVITGTLLGNVNDTSKATLPNVSVVVRNQDTNIETRTTTSRSGDFVVPLLPPGRYEVVLSAPGFSEYRDTNLLVGVDSKVRVNATLVVGSVNQSTEVRSDEVPLQTDASDLNRTVSQEVFDAIPNVGRSPLRAAGLLAGITPRPGFNNLSNIPINEDSRRAFSDFTINGGRPGGTEILLDGAPDTSGAFNEIAVLPNNDAIGQFKIITNAYSAEFGRAGSGVVQMTTKSGTNHPHGTVYEYFRNSALNANTYGNNYFNLPRGVFNLHQFGATLSGPVFAPHYDGRDRTFLFLAFEGIRRAQNASGFLNVPTALERQGDFSQSLALVAGALTPVNIYNPSPDTSTLTAAGNGVIRQQFQSGGVLNKIPSQYLNATSLQLIQAMPLPNRTSPTGDGQQNFFYGGSEYSSTQQVIARLDHQINKDHRLTVRFTQDWSLDTPANPYSGTIPQAWRDMPTNQFNPSLALMHVWTVSPRDLVELRVNASRVNLQKLPIGGFNANLAKLGFSPDMLATARYGDYPSIGGGTNFSQIGHNTFDVRDNHTTNWSTNGSYTRVLNRLTLKMGGEYRIYLNNFSQPNVPSFAFSPVTSFTTQCSGNGCPTVAGNLSQGSAFASLLIGALDGAADSSNGQYATGDFPIALSAKYAAVYMQNDWRVSDRLTLNLGVRWDYSGSLRERYDRLSQFDLDATNITETRGRYTFPNFQGNGPGRKDDRFNDFAPRVGFAYRPIPGTVLRSAYGISYDPVTGTGSGILGFGADGFRALSFLRIRPSSGAFNLLDVLDRPYNNAFAGGGKPLGKNPDDPGFLGYNVIAVPRREGGDPNMQQWNLTLEQQLPKHVDLQVSYVGTKGTHLLVNFTEINGVNALAPSLLSQWRDTYVNTSANPANARVPNPFYVAAPGTPLIGSGNPNVAGPSITQSQINRPFPAYPSVRLGYSRYGSSSYNGLQLSMRRAFASGFEVGGNYTWSKLIDSTVDNSAGAGNTAGPSNRSFSLYNLRLDRSVSQFDTPHRGVIYTVIASPFGRGGHFLTQSPVANIALAGWKLSTNTQFQSGLALGISSNGGFGRPDVVGNAALQKSFRCVGPKTCQLPDGSSMNVPAGRLLYFNPKAYRNRVIQFGANAGANAGKYADDIYWYGTAPRLSSKLRGWGVDNTDLSLSRTIPLHESLDLNFRADVVNIFNRTSFSDGSIDKGFGSSFLPGNTSDGTQVARAGQSTNSTFGTIDVTGQGISPRYLQFAARVSF